MPRSPDSAEDGSKARQTPYVLGLIFVILAAGIVTAGYFYHRNYEQHYRAEVERQLSAVAELKADELADWREERLGDAHIFFKNAAFSALVRRFFDAPEDVDAREQIRAWLSQVHTAYQYDRVFLLDAEYSKKMMVPDVPVPERVTSAVSQSAAEILRSGNIAFEDFYWNEQNQRIYLKVLVPILEGGSGSPLVAVVALRIDPATHLYTYLSRWPTPSRTAETLLVRRDGNDVLFLNNLRFQKDAALNLRVSLKEGKDLPAVKAAMGEEGIVEGTDYRGEPVIAAVRAVPDSPWFLVARMDAAEVYAPLRERLWAMVVVVGVLVLGTGAALGFVWRQQSVRFYRERYAAAEALRELNQQFNIMLESIPDHMSMIDKDLNIVWANRVSKNTFGQDVIGKKCYAAYYQRTAPCEPFSCIVLKAFQDGKVHTHETQVVGKGGETIFFFCSANVALWEKDGRPKTVIEISTDITERRRAEEALRESEAIYRTLAENIPQKVFVKGRDLRYVSVNENFARDLGIRPAEAVGKVDYDFFPKELADKYRADDRRIMETGRTDELDEKYVQGGKEVWVHTVKAPVRNRTGEIVGVFGIFWDITERKHAEESLRDSERRFRELAESLPQLVWTCRADGPCDYLSPQWVEYTGIPEAEQLGSGWLEQLHPDDRDRTIAAWNAAVGSESFFDVEFRIRRKDGIYRWFQTRAVAIHDGQGRVVKWFGTNTDIDDQKQAEEALEGAKQKAEAARWRAETIGAVTAEVSRHMKPREIAEVVVRHLSGALHTPRCSMVLRTDDADGVEVVALYRDGKPAPFGHKGPMTLAEHPYIAEAMRERQTVVVRSQERHELALRGQTAVDKPWYYIMVPIATGEDVFGTVNVAVVDPQTTYDDQDLLMVETMCRHAAQALKNAAMVDDLEHAHAEMEKANTRLEKLATTDDLTALANRRRFLEAIGLETERARRYGSDLALAMIDVDGFKAINDMCGHVFGDRVLVEVARAIEEGARAADLVARYGGDEIIVLMPSTDARQAVNAVERIRRRIAGRVISDGQRSLEVAISAGVSALDSKDRTAGPDLLIRQADEALYAAKHAGGNVTKTWNEVTQDRTGEIADEAAGVEDLRRKVAGLSLQAKEMVVQSLWGLVHALEARDSYTKAHSANVTRYAVAIAETLELDPEETAVIRRAAMVHDIGKIAVPDSILRKRGALDDHERRIMQRHVLAGVKIIDQMHFLERETPIVRHHHEHWTGGGYPDGISGEAIPLGARILAVADAFDAITADRVYRKARPVSEALQVLIEESGRQFAPGVVDAMVKWVLEIGRELGKESDLAVADLLQSQPAPVPA